MLQQAKDEDLTINVRHAKVLFCGAAKAGKTSFSHLLRNKEHDTDYKSTPAGDVQQVLVSDKVNVVGTNWISLDSKLETQQITNRLIAKLQNQKENKSPIHQNITRKFKNNSKMYNHINKLLQKQHIISVKMYLIQNQGRTYQKLTFLLLHPTANLH